MCGMFFTFNKDNIEILSKYNARRGGINETLTEIEIEKDILYVGHFQAPTSALSQSQPLTRLKKYKFWHNGILKESQIESLYELYKDQVYNLTKWDTELLFNAIAYDYDLGDIDGSFAVFYTSGNEISFSRNALAPLFMNTETLELSSVKIPELGITTNVPHGVWHCINSKGTGIVALENSLDWKTFSTRNNPYDI